MIRRCSPCPVSFFASHEATAIKIVGAQGQGVNSVGEMCAKGLKRAGYCVFGNREYMSVIKGGHSSYQLDVSDEPVCSSSSLVDVVISFNHHGIRKNLKDIKPGGILIHQTPQWSFKEEDQQFIEEQGIHVVYLPTEDILRKLNAKPILANVLITAVVWLLLGRSKVELKELVRERFGHKPDLLDLNFACLEEGFAFHKEQEGLMITLPDPSDQWKDQLLLTGSQAMGMGMIAAGCRVFASYPMTPASPLLTFIADTQRESQMVVKQAEDEITAVQVAVGAMHMGARAATATSGGGYDLMTETVSLCGVSETPLVVVLAQRPGPGTGLPTWTAQGDLLLAVGSGHGEFPRLVLSVSDARDCFSLMPQAFNLAEEYQLPVIVLTDKQTAEALYTQPAFDTGHVVLHRGRLITDPAECAKLRPEDRYDPSVPNGVSKRWLPGTQAETYCAQGYEHAADGSFDESGENAALQADKRMRKMATLKDTLPDPEYFGEENPGVLVVGWGSTKGAVLNAMTEIQNPTSDTSIGYLHFTYLWPLKTEVFEELGSKAKKTVLIEGNKQGQLGMLLKQECGKDFDEKFLKYDGRAFTCDELISLLSEYL